MEIPGKVRNSTSAGPKTRADGH